MRTAVFKASLIPQVLHVVTGTMCSGHRRAAVAESQTDNLWLILKSPDKKISACWQFCGRQLRVAIRDLKAYNETEIHS